MLFLSPSLSLFSHCVWFSHLLKSKKNKRQVNKVCLRTISHDPKSSIGVGLTTINHDFDQQNNMQM